VDEQTATSDSTRMADGGDGSSGSDRGAPKKIFWGAPWGSPHLFPPASHMDDVPSVTGREGEK
jgi:hypothetical protein